MTKTYLDSEVVTRISNLLNILCGYKVGVKEKVSELEPYSLCYVVDEYFKIPIHLLRQDLADECRDNPETFLYAIAKRALGEQGHHVDVQNLIRYIIKAAKAMGDYKYIPEPDCK